MTEKSSQMDGMDGSNPHPVHYASYTLRHQSKVAQLLTRTTRFNNRFSTHGLRNYETAQYGPLRFNAFDNYCFFKFSYLCFLVFLFTVVLVLFSSVSFQSSCKAAIFSINYSFL